MNCDTFFNSCYFLSTLSVCNFKSKYLEFDFKHFVFDQSATVTTIMNIAKGALFGCIITFAQELVSKTFSYKLFMIPTAIITSISVMTYIARKTNHFVEKAENLDKNIGRIFDIATSICCISSLIFLAPDAKYSPLSFTFAAGVVGIDFLYSLFLNDINHARSQSPFNHRF